MPRVPPAGTHGGPCASVAPLRFGHGQALMRRRLTVPPRRRRRGKGFKKEQAMRTDTPVPTRNPRSTAQVAGHPLHPMLIPFPVAFLVATLVSDLIFWRTGNSGWSTASLYLLGAALIMAALAALAGLADFLGDSRIRDLSAAWHHMVGNVVAVLLSLWNWYRRYEAGEGAGGPTRPLI